jgi:hypothetical protein
VATPSKQEEKSLDYESEPHSFKFTHFQITHHATPSEITQCFNRARMCLYNFLSDEERRLFTTKPKEVTA